MSWEAFSRRPPRHDHEGAGPAGATSPPAGSDRRGGGDPRGPGGWSPTTAAPDGCRCSATWLSGCSSSASSVPRWSWPERRVRVVSAPTDATAGLPLEVAVEASTRLRIRPVDPPGIERLRRARSGDGDQRRTPSPWCRRGGAPTTSSWSTWRRPPPSPCSGGPAGSPCRSRRPSHVAPRRGRAGAARRRPQRPGRRQPRAGVGRYRRAQRRPAVSTGGRPPPRPLAGVRPYRRADGPGAGGTGRRAPHRTG